MHLDANKALIHIYISSRLTYGLVQPPDAALNEVRPPVGKLISGMEGRREKNGGQRGKNKLRRAESS